MLNSSGTEIQFSYPQNQWCRHRSLSEQIWEYHGNKNWGSRCRRCGLIPGSRRSPRVGNGNPLQYSYLEKFHGERSLVGYSPSMELQSRTRLSTHSLLCHITARNAYELSHVRLFVTPRMDCSPPGSSVHAIFPGKTTGMGCYFLSTAHSSSSTISWIWWRNK